MTLSDVALSVGILAVYTAAVALLARFMSPRWHPDAGTRGEGWVEFDDGRRLYLLGGGGYDDLLTQAENAELELMLRRSDLAVRRSHLSPELVDDVTEAFQSMGHVGVPTITNVHGIAVID